MLISRLTLFLRSAWLGTLLAVAACQTTPPVQEMSDARQAISAAQNAGAPDKAATQYDAAVGFLKKAETALNNREYARARHDALQAKNKALEALQRSETEQDSNP
jgi:HAMP domain-containing protein